MLEMVLARDKDPAFCLPTKNGVKPITYNDLQNFIKGSVKKLGYNEKEFSSHSLRRAGATWAFKSNVPGELIKIQGDWKSDAYLRYLEISEEERLVVAKCMVSEIRKLRI